MDKIYEAVLAIMRAALFDAPLNVPADTDWPAVYQELQQQAVADIPAAILSDFPGLPEEFQTRWAYGAILRMRRFYHILQEQSDAIALLQAADIKAVVLKGSAAAIYYPNPDQRATGDVDLLVEKGKAEEAYQVLQKNGYQLSMPFHPGDRHYHLNKNDVEFELHCRFAISEDPQIADDLDSLLYQGIEQAQTKEIGGFYFPALPELQNGLVLLMHTSQHMSEGVGLRHLLDWTMYASSIMDDTFWKSSFEAAAERIGLATFATALTRMAQMHLGLSTEHRQWCSSTDAATCDSLLEYVLEGGNFGSKRGKTRETAMILSNYRSVTELIKRLQAEGTRNFPKLFAKFAFLKPFAWFFRLCRLAFLGLKKGLRISDLKEAYGDSRDRIVLFEKLGLQMLSEKEHES